MAAAACYAAAAAILVSLLVEKSRTITRVCLYILLAFNPFIADYLVPARGYSPAMACEMVTLVLIYIAIVKSNIVNPPLIGISIVAALGVTFNYAFLFTFSALLFCTFLFLLTPFRSMTRSTLFGVGVRIFGPFVAVLTVLCGDNIVTMPKAEIAIGWGSRSIGKMFASIAQFSFNNPNPFLTPPALRQILLTVTQIAPAVVVAMFAATVILLGFRRREGPRDFQATERTRQRFFLLLLADDGTGRPTVYILSRRIWDSITPA
jgi:hypothetical protein